jgi:tetratricopeptide (TPR) repeat protein
VVDAIEQVYAARLEEHTERLAHHALRAELLQQAVAYSREASAKSATRSAFREATTWLEEALRGLEQLPDCRETQEAAIDIRLDLRKWLATLGEFHPVLAYLHEAEVLAEALGDRRRLAMVYSNVASHHQQVGDSQLSVEYGERALELANALGSLPIQFVVTFDLGLTRYTRGEYRQAVSHFRWAADHFEGDPLRERFDTAYLAAVTAPGWLAYTLSTLGEFREATLYRTEAIRVAETAGHPLSQTGAYNNAGLIHLEKGDFDIARTVLEGGVALAQAADLRFRARLMSGHLGYVYAQTGRIAEGVALLEQSMEHFAAMGHRAYQSLRAGWLSEAYLLAGRQEDAHRLAEQAVDLAVRHRESGHQARALRMLAETAARSDPADVDEAEQRYREALTLAEELGMRPLQARCHLGLGKLYRQTERTEEARAQLTSAAEMLREMGMTFWLPEAEAELAQAGGSPSGSRVG